MVPPTRTTPLALQAQKNTKTDLLWRNYTTGENALWTLNGTSVSTTAYLQTTADLNWELVGAGSFTGQGQTDLVWRNNTTGQNAVWQMNGTTLVTSLALTPLADSHWRVASVADWNGDGHADLLWRNVATGANMVWQMQGTTSVATLNLPPVTDLNWQLVGSGDFNRDGQADLVWRNQSTGANVVWQLQGTTLQTAVSFQIAEANWHIEGVADFNGDDHPDLVWRNYATGEDAIWLLNGTTLLASGDVYFTRITDVHWQIAAPFNVYGAPGLVDLGGPTTATAFDLGTLNGQATYRSTISSNGGSDYYRFQLPAANPNVYLQASTGNLELLANSGSVLQRAVTTGAPVHLQPTLASGSYLRVYGTTSYTLGVFDTMAPPTVTPSLVNDTARSGSAPDNRTADPTVAVQIGSEHWLGHLTAGFNTTDPSSFLDLTTLATLGQRFTLTPTLLQQINGGVALTAGSYMLHLRATGVYDVTATTTDLTFTLDTTTVAPSGLHLAGVTGTATNTTTPTVTGVAEVGALVQVFNAAQVLLGQGVADSTGTWQALLSPLTDGTYPVTAVATDLAGNVSTVSAPLSLVVDTTLPTLTVTTPLTAPLVHSTRLTGTVSGTGSAIASLTYHFDARAAVTLAADPATGSFDQALDLTGLTNGTHTLTLTATDAAGNVKTWQNPVTLSLGAVPVLTAALAQDTAAGGFTNADGVTSDPTISGQVTTTQPLAALRAGFVTATGMTYTDIMARLQADGSFTLNRTQLAALHGGSLLDAHYTLSLQAADTAGNVTAPWSVTFDLDTQAPIAPTNLSLSPSGKYAVAISGNAEAGAQVQLFEGTTLIGEAVANATGSWRMTTSQLRNGTHDLTATASDAAGNTSPTTTAAPFTVATLVPTTPQGLRLTALTDSGQSQTDNITNVTTPTIVGTTEAGATVRLFQGQQLLGETSADGSGNWQFALTTALPQGEQTLSVVAHNAIGDSQTATLTTTIDSVAPTTTQLNFLAAGSTTATTLANGVTLTTGTRLLGQVSGTTSALASLQYQLGTSPAVTVPVAANGLFNYRLDLTGSSSGDDQTLTVTMTDVAGNTTTLAPYLVNISATNDGGGEAPVLLAQLMQDTGSNTTDGWTYIPGIAGVASAPGVITTLLATFDTAATAAFQDLTAWLQPDGTFALDEETLAALAGGDLADGAYTLRLRVQADTNQIAEQVVSLTLDRTAPVTTLPDLIDGIAWERGTHLQGTVQEDSGSVNVAYQLETVTGGDDWDSPYGHDDWHYV